MDRKEAGRPYIYINKESQRVSKDTLKTLDGKDVLLIFPQESRYNKTVQLLKTPKTESSVRKIFLPKSVALMLQDWKKQQDDMIEILGDEYQNYNLVFHSFRHSSITYKLKLNGGDIKAVQGDSGHSQASMVSEVYSHIIDDDRRRNAELFENAFYKKKNLNPSMHPEEEKKDVPMPEGVDQEMVMKVLSNPEMMSLLTALAKTMK